ncbi:hypothetical protein ACWA1B_22355, partial [Flavobacterium sp. 3-210]
AKTLTYTDEKEQTHVLDLESLVGNAETKTTLVYDSTSNKLTYNGESGIPTVINLQDLVGNAQTVTTLVKDSDNNGKYTYTNEDKTPTTINVVQDVIDNFTNVLDGERTDKGQTAHEAISTIVKAEQSLTSLEVKLESDGAKLVYTDENENSREIPVSMLETKTYLQNNGGGSYVYTNEEGAPSQINIVQDVADNFTNIAGLERNEGGGQTVRDILRSYTYEDQTVTSLVHNSDAKTLTYKDELGIPTVIDLQDLVGDSQTVTTLEKNGKGLYTYTSEDATITNIDVVQDVIDNSSTIFEKTKVIDEITKLIGL